MSSPSSPNMSISNCTVGVVATGSGYVHIGGSVFVTSTGSNNDFALPQSITSFHGRENELLELESIFFTQKKSKAVICGLPGMGKSELAKQFANICLSNKKIEKSFWIKTEDKDELEKSYSTLNNIYEESKDKLYLFIFDNGLSRQDIAEYEPPDNYLMLITSQESDWGRDVQSVKLDPLSPTFALEVLKSVLVDKYTERDINLYKKLCDNADNVPLALQIIGGYLRQQIDCDKQFNLKEYTDMQSQMKIINQKIPRSCANGYNKSIYSAMAVSLNKIREEKLALKSLYVCCYLDPDYILIKDLMLILNCDITQNQLRDALRLLSNFSFVNYDKNNSLSIHRLTQSFLISYLNENEPQIACKNYKSCLNFIFDSSFFTAHSNSVISFAENNVSTVYDFYKEHAHDFDLTKLLLQYLVIKGSIKCLTKIFQDAGDRREACILQCKLLHFSVSSNQIDVLQFLLKYSDVNMTDDNENTVLHNASRNINIIKCLIDHGANVDARNCMGDIPLFRFIKRYNSSKTLNWNDILKIFKFSKHTTKQNKQTLLHLAVIGYHSDLVKLLIFDYQVEINQTDALQRTPLDALFIETKSSSYFDNTVVNKIIATLKQLLQHEARFNVVESLKDIPGILLLQNAAKVNDMQLFSWLLQNGASVNNVLDTSLHRAIAKCFLKSGKLTNSDTSGLVLLNYAVDNDEMELLEWLLQSGINVNSTSADSCYETALFTAIVKENVKATEILVKYNAAVNIRNVFGDTASVKLIQQACKNNTDVNTLSKILDLLKCEETSATTDSIGNTLLHWASSWKRHKLVILLADKFQFNVNKQNFEGNTPLHEVILWLNDTSNMEDVRNTVEALKIFGARLNLKNNNLETALEMLQKERKHFSGLNLENLIKLLKDDDNDDLGTANVN